MAQTKRRVLSLFSGCGGMDLGFEGGFRCLAASVNEGLHPDWTVSSDGIWSDIRLTGFETVFACDIRPDAAAVWTNYFGRRREAARTAFHLGSVVDLCEAARRGEPAFPSDIDVVTGGFPCQDFSVSGLRRGFDSKRSHDGGALDPGEPSMKSRGSLYMWMREVVSIVRPKVFVAENVKGLVSLGDAKAVIERDFRAAGGGYLVVPARVLATAAYGVPQRRERVVFIGLRKDALRPKALSALSADPVPAEYDPYPEATHAWGECALRPALEPVVTCAEAFVGLPEPENSADACQRHFSRARYMGPHCQGQREVPLDSAGPTVRSGHHGNIEYRRLSAARGGVHAGELAAGLSERRLTVRECMRLQSFPDDFDLMPEGPDGRPLVSGSKAYELVGNAVPPVLAYHVAMSLASKWDRWFV